MTNGGLIGGLCGGFGALLLGIGIGICLVCYLRRQDKRLRCAVNNYRRESPPVPVPAPYVPREPTLTSTRYPSQTRDASPSCELAHRSREPEISTDREPPSYSSIWEMNGETRNTLSIGDPQSGSHTPITAVQHSSPVPSTDAGYQPPPPEYEMTVEYPDLYKVTDREPKFV